MSQYLRIQNEIHSGTSPVCASCKHFWVAKDAGLESCGQDCGGPIAGKDFPKYDGPMTSLDKFCFACISEADYVVRSVGASRLVGICRRHLPLLDRLRTTAADVTVEVMSPKGIVAPVGGRYTPKSLGEVIADTEAGWKKNG